MNYPFGFEGFEDKEDISELHPTHLELQSYCERSLHSLAEIGEDEFMKMERHVSDCDSCLMVMIRERIRLHHVTNEPVS
jgi:hypothetical protein